MGNFVKYECDGFAAENHENTGKLSLFSFIVLYKGISMAFKRSRVRISSAPLDKKVLENKGNSVENPKGNSPRSVQQIKNSSNAKKVSKRAPRQLKIPKLLVHARSGQAYLVDPGPPRKQIPMGPGGTPQAETNYRRWVTGYLERKAPTARAMPGNRPQFVAGLLGAWLGHCRTKYSRAEIWSCVRASELASQWATMRVEEFSRAELVQIRDTCLETMNRQSSHIMVDRVVRAFRWGESRDWVESSQVLRLSKWERLRPTEGRSSKVAKEFGQVELFRVWRELREPWKTAFLFHAWTAQRVETALGARADQIDRTAIPWEYCPTKHKNTWRGKKLTILIGPRARKAIAPLMELGGWLFPSTPNGKSVGYAGPLTHAGYRRALATASKRAGLPEALGGRCIRHTAATVLRNRGVGLDIIAAILGHTGPGGFRMTENYAKLHRNSVTKTVEENG